MSEQDDLHFGGACERCGSPITVRMMSYFMEQMICQHCHERESDLLERLGREGGDVQAFAGCGYLPGSGSATGREEK